MSNSPMSAPRHSIRRHLLGGGVIALILTIGLGGWAATTELAGAAIAQGFLVVDSNVKKVQHPTGGVIGEVRVRDGDRVRAGDIVVRLDETQTRANLGIITKGLDELAARQARNEAERDEATEVAFPSDLLARASDPQVAHVIAGEQKLFEIRRAAREGQKAQLRERITQLQDEIRGLEAQEEAKVVQIEWINKELEGVRELWEKQLVQFIRLTTLERDAARLRGERGQLIAAIAQAKGRINEITLQILQVDAEKRSEVSKELAEIRAKTSELSERKVTAEDQLKRIDIRAPQDGTVHQLAVHTVDGVVAPGEQLMLIVPATDALAVEARIMPQEIDQIRLGQTAILRFSAFNQRTTPELTGEVSRISADTSQDQKTGIAFYTVRVTVPQRELARLDGLKLVPGMPVETFIQTAPRSVLSYFTKPLSDQMNRAFKAR
jgi:membrane fusion protein, type I secretion system